MAPQIARNRRNALRSTGPRTPEGKAKVSGNALRHGVYSEAVLLLEEDPAAFDVLRIGIVKALSPVGPLEEYLVARMVSTWWRLERAGRAERERFKATLENARHWEGGTRLRSHDPLEDVNPRPAPDYTEPVHTAFTWRDAGDGMDRLLRYEGQLERSFFRLLHELERLQARRHGQAVPPPVAVEVNLSRDEN